MKDTYHDTKAVQAIVPAAKTDAENGAAIDLKGFNAALIVVTTGAIAGSGDFGFKLQHSDTDVSGDFEDVDAEDVLGTAPAEGMAQNSAYTVGYTGGRRFLRVATIDNGGTSVVIGAVAILSHPHLAPVN